MPLTIETQALLDARREANLPEFHTVSPTAAREMMVEMREALGPVVPESVARIQNRTIPGPAGGIPVRIYWPVTDTPAPLFVYYHGGGWVIGDLESHDGTCRALANLTRCCVVSVDYRLAPEHRYPAAPEDCYAATEWVSEHAAELEADSARLVVGGDSAGGNLAAVVALMARDRGNLAIQAQILIYPVTDFDFNTDSYRDNGDGSYGLSEIGMRWFWDCYVQTTAEGREPYASPLRSTDLSGLPKAMVITAEYDPLRDEAEAYAKQLEQANISTQLMRYDGVTHGFVSQAAHIPEGRAALEWIGEEIRTTL